MKTITYKPMRHSISNGIHTNSRSEHGTRAWIMAGLLCLLAAGCAAPKIDPSRPVEYTIFVQADGLWQNTGVFARRGQLIQTRAEGEWGDGYEKFDADGDRRTYKNHHGVNAPAYGLLMMISTETNRAYFAGSESGIHAERSGYVMFRSNASLPHRAVGRMKVLLQVADDTDGNGVSDYDEIHIWGTDPLDPDTDGLGLGDLHKVERMKAALEAAEEEAEAKEENDRE